MSFINEMKNEMSNELIETENGALGYASSGKKLLDFFYKVSSYRSMNDADIVKDFSEAWLENHLLATKMLFFVGDIRQGLGERKTFKACLDWMARFNTDECAKLVKLIPEYGRWDYLIDLYFCGVEKVQSEVFDVVKEQLVADILDSRNRKPVSLLAKWMPSINCSNKEQIRKAKKLAKALKFTDKEYRKTLSELRAYIDVVEVKTCANEWEKIDYNTVPSKANLKYRNAFMLHDAERREKYLADLEGNVAGVKMNSSVAYPYDIAHNYGSLSWVEHNVKNYDATLEQMWKALPDYVNGECGTICVVDGSGSMMSTIGGTNLSCLEVANSLGIYMSERMSGEFANKFITFSKKPQLVEFEKEWSLHDKLEHAYRYDECSNTDIEKTFDLILSTAKNGHLRQEELPKNILILSDMEFDQCTDNVDSALFETIKSRFTAEGYKMPRLVFWNLNSRTNAIPLKENESGVLLVSGFSPSIFDMVASGEVDPYKALLAKLNSDRYDSVEKAIKEI